MGRRKSEWQNQLEAAENRYGNRPRQRRGQYHRQ